MAKPTYGENDRRIERLEKLFAAAEDDKYQSVDPDFTAIDREFRALGQGPYWRGGVKIEPPDEIEEYYGRGDYTKREHFELAVRRGLEKRGYASAQIAEQMGKWMAIWDETGVGGST
jgi:hypothetical protein